MLDSEISDLKRRVGTPVRVSPETVGLAADLVTAEMLGAGAAGVCINMGGDVRVAGADPGGGSWTVAVEHRWSPNAGRIQATANYSQYQGGVGLPPIMTSSPVSEFRRALR